MNAQRKGQLQGILGRLGDFAEIHPKYYKAVCMVGGGEL